MASSSQSKAYTAQGPYRSEFKYRRHLTIVAIVITVGNNNPTLCICGNDGGNYDFAKIIIYFRDDVYIRDGTLPPYRCMSGVQAWCEMGRVMTPVRETVESLDGDDWLGSSSQLGSSDATQPTPPLNPFRQSLDPVAELHQEEHSSSKGERLCLHRTLVAGVQDNMAMLQIASSMPLVACRCNHCQRT